jgi:hypothetical protein
VIGTELFWSPVAGPEWSAAPSRIASLSIATALAPFFEAVRQHDFIGLALNAKLHLADRTTHRVALRDAAHALPQLAPALGRTLYGALRLGDPLLGERIEPYIRTRVV